MKVIFQGDAAPGVTVVSNEFIDRYMPSVNGAYVKVYLYLLRHQGEEVTDARIADSLELTEGDVRRALLRWQREGLIAGDFTEPERQTEEAEVPRYTEVPRYAAEPQQEEKKPELPAEPVCSEKSETSVPEKPETVLPPAKLPDKSGVDFSRLQNDGEFAGLSYALQRYLGKTFSQTDSETVAYLYGTLGMSSDLLIKLGEICAEKKKSSLRYFEKVAIDWYERGIKTPEEAELRGENYTREVYAVLNAFGIRDRGPGIEEKKYIEKWYHDYGFSEELVVEACSRTLRHVHKPNFPYTDGILTKWQRAGVHSLRDVAEEDKKREESGGKRSTPKTDTRFHNFEERDEDPNDLVLQQLKRKLEQDS